MNKLKWTATKKECSVDSEGKLKTDKVTFEKNKKELLPPHKKDFIDLLIRSIGALAIFTPLLLLYLQRQNEINKEQEKNVSELFTNVATDIQIIINSNVETKEFMSAYENILFKYSPRIRLLKDDSLIHLYSLVIAYTKNHQYLKEIISLKDSTVSQSYQIFSDANLEGIIPMNGHYEGPDKIKLRIPKDLIIAEVRKSHSNCYDLNTKSYGYKSFVEKNKIPISSNYVISYISDSLSNLALYSQNELLAFEDYLTVSTGWFNKEYLNKNTTGKTIESLNSSSKKLAEILEINTEKMEFYRNLLERKMLQIL